MTERQFQPPTYEQPSLPEVVSPTGPVDKVRVESLKSELRHRTDWYNPFVIDGDLLPLKQAWMKDFHYYRHNHIFQAILRDIGTLDGMRVLDIGCNEGYYSFAARRLGAEEVVGIDLRSENIECAQKLADVYGYNRCSFRSGNIVGDDFTSLGSFDVVFCFGVLYHLENPMIGIRNLRQITGKRLYIDSCLSSFDSEPTIAIAEEPNTNLRAGETGLAFYPSIGGLRKMLEAGGFQVETIPATSPPFWSPYCHHDYRKNQVSIICR